MPYFLVDIRGDAYRAMGLLAKAGIQNIASDEEPTKLVTARLSSETAESARGRVLAALCGRALQARGGSGRLLDTRALRGPMEARARRMRPLAAGVSIFELARVMGASVRTIDRHYGHLARDSEGAIRARLNARAGRSGDVVATGEDG